MTMRTFLVVFSLLLSVTLGLLLRQSGAGALASPAGARPLRIGLSMDTLKEARWQGDRDTFVKRARELGAEVLVQAANSDDAKQIADVKALITSGVDVLVIVPHDGAAMAEAVRLAHASSIPVVAYDRLIRDADVDLYVSFDNLRVGELQAEYMVKRFQPTPERPLRLVRIHGAPTDNNAKLLQQGQNAILQPLIERGAVQVQFEDWTDDWKPENAKRIMNAAITRHGATFDAVLAANDGTAGGAIQALEEEGLTGKAVVTGQDADLVAVQRIARGSQAMTIYKPLNRLASGAADVTVALAKRKPIIARAGVDNGKIEVPSVLFQVITVTRDNLRATVIKDGFHSETAVFGEQAKAP
jgi:D-xylose transport system substrate-binding protein